ncbi:type IX secretion system periplasmic lipoprotein PorW/SprE [Lunatibacter salilacus]|uniref:type IX secretion system periplasmic lipoprotein PorW/SprE n=1 Tax=Lunatibacter salilacus TaxID=2483804 RepID=UPI00131C14B6|nr:tetratricopeptide repeat protein [Lunatibacter salilacus]
MNKVLNRKILLVAYLLGCVLVFSCTSQKDTFMNRLYHNTTARFNAYYLAKEKMEELDRKIMEEYEEDFSQILPVFYPLDSAVIEGSEAELDEIRSLCSKAIDWHRISNWVDPSYFLLGKVDYYMANFDDAQNTFKYLNVNSKQDEVRHLSLIHLLRLFVDLEKFDDAVYVMDFLSKETYISDENRYMLYKTLAYYYEAKKEQDMVAPALFRALEFAENKNDISRINFILGQLYQRAGLDAVAYEYYQKAVTGSPTYERTFFAQLFSQQVAELEKSKDFRRVRSYYDDLYKDRKNIEFRDVILYEKAMFEYKQEEIPESIRLLSLAAKEPTENRRQKGYIYQKLADIYLRDNNDYLTTKYYLDSAMEQFRETDRNYAALAAQKEVFDNYALNFELIQRNDSLIALSKLSPEEQEAFVEDFLKNEEARLLREAEAAKSNKSSRPFENLLASVGGASGSTFYWDNPTAIQQGAIEFSRVWGKRDLTDHWRRSNKSFQESSMGQQDEQNIEPSAELAIDGGEQTDGQVPTLPDRNSLLERIPKDESTIKNMLDEMEDGYFNLGKLLFFDLKEPQKSIAYLEKLVSQYPNSIKKPEAYYTMYLAFKELNENTAHYANLLNEEFPDSQYTKSVNNPESVSGTQANFESSRNYREAYILYQSNEFDQSRSIIRSTLDEYPLSKNTDRLLLLDIMISGKSGNTQEFVQRLETYILNVNDLDLLYLAKNMLRNFGGTEDGALADNTMAAEGTSEGELESTESIDETPETPAEESPYSLNLNQTHVFILAIEPGIASESKNLTADLENFHSQNFTNDRLRTGTISLTRENTIVIISPFSNGEKATKYREEFLKSFNTENLSEELKMSSFVISIENFQQLNKRKDIDEYKAFYKESY